MYTLATTYIVLSVASCVEEKIVRNTAEKASLVTFIHMEDSKAVKDTLDSLHVTALGTDSIILNREPKFLWSSPAFALYQWHNHLCAESTSTT